MTKEQALAYINSFLNQAGTETGLPYFDDKSVKTVTRYITGLGSEVTGRNGEIIEASTKKEFGVTNFDNGNWLGANEYLMVTGIRILIDKSTANVTGKTGVWKDTAPANWMNGELVISDEDGTLFESSISDVHNFRVSTGNDADFRVFTPFQLRPEKRFSIKALLAGGGGSSEAFKLELRCIQFKR